MTDHVRSIAMKKEPVRLFGYTATGLIILAIGVATAALKAPTWREGVLAGLAALAAGIGGTEQLRSRVWSSVSHREAVDAAVRPATVKAPGPRPIPKQRARRH